MSNFLSSNTTDVHSGPAFSKGDTATQSLPKGETLNTTATGTKPLGTDGDFITLFEVRDGGNLHGAHLETEDMDTGTALLADIVLRIPDENGDAAVGAPDVVLFAGTTLFRAAFKEYLFFFDEYVNASKAVAGRGHVGFLVNTAAGTGVATAGIKMNLYHS